MKVYGDFESAKPLTVGKSRVYVRRNICESDDASRGAYMWDEEVYAKDEYIKILNQHNETLENGVIELAALAAAQDDAIVEIAELIAESEVENNG